MMYVAACLLDISFVVDYSGSIQDTNPPGVSNWQFIIEFMVKLVSSINIGQSATHVGAVSFGTQLTVLHSV